MKYRKKPVIIEAFKWDASNSESTVAPLWLLDKFNEFIRFYDDGTIKIKTLEGEMTVSDGDYIIKGVQGEIYPCKPDIFDMTYEQVEE